MSEELPDDVRRFVIEHINSVEQLEALLLLWAHADQSWTAEAVSQRLYTSPAAATMRLDDLARRGFIAVDPDPALGFRYRHSELDRLVSRLSELYRERRVSIITLIYSKPQQQVQAFADAFKLRKQNEKD
jgi:DNA-binding MarR family transcriptional regulator